MNLTCFTVAGTVCFCVVVLYISWIGFMDSVLFLAFRLEVCLRKLKIVIAHMVNVIVCIHADYTAILNGGNLAAILFPEMRVGFTDQCAHLRFKACGQLAQRRLAVCKLLSLHGYSFILYPLADSNRYLHESPTLLRAVIPLDQRGKSALPRGAVKPFYSLL